MKSFVVDTNVFLRLILDDIPQQADEAEELIKQAKNQKIKLIVPQIVIFEIEFALEKYYGFAKSEIIDKLSSIVSAKYLNIENKDIFNMSIKLYEKSNLSLVDCFLKSYSVNTDSEVFSFDKDFKKLAKA